MRSRLRPLWEFLELNEFPINSDPNRRMPECNSALQTERSFFNPKFDQISPKIAKFLAFFEPKIPQKCLGIPLINN